MIESKTCPHDLGSPVFGFTNGSFNVYFTESDKYLIVSGQGNTNCDNFWFKLRSLFQIEDPLLRMSSNQIQLTLSEKNKEYLLENNVNWEVEVIEALTGKTVYCSNVEDMQIYINISEWKRGLYFIKNRIGEELIVQKVNIP